MLAKRQFARLICAQARAKPMPFRMMTPIIKPQIMAFSSLSAPIKINRNPIQSDLDALKAILPPTTQT